MEKKKKYILLENFHLHIVGKKGDKIDEKKLEEAIKNMNDMLRKYPYPEKSHPSLLPNKPTKKKPKK